MDGVNERVTGKERAMTIAQKNARRKQTLEALKDRIITILKGQNKPIGLDEIIYFLQKDCLERGVPLDSVNPFDVRDVVNELSSSNKVKEAVGRDVELVR